VRWAGYVAYMVEGILHKILVGKLKEKDLLENLGIDERIILK
jgi:hypothetical protein